MFTHNFQQWLSSIKYNSVAAKDVNISIQAFENEEQKMLEIFHWLGNIYGEGNNFRLTNTTGKS